ncbi:MAG: hypothetical protein ACK45F_02770 [bacterium]
MTTDRGARGWKVLLATGSLLASVVGWGVLAARDVPVAFRELGRPAVREADGTELELLPPVPSVHRPVAASRSSR